MKAKAQNLKTKNNKNKALVGEIEAIGREDAIETKWNQEEEKHGKSKAARGTFPMHYDLTVSGRSEVSKECAKV